MNIVSCALTKGRGIARTKKSFFIVARGLYEQAQQKEETGPGFQKLQDRLIISEKTGLSENVDLENIDIREVYAKIIKENTVITDGSHIKNGELQSNVTYMVGEHNYLYQTGSNKTVLLACADSLGMKKHDERKNHVRNTPGKLEGDHAGHLIADLFGGDRGLGNVVSQLAQVNWSEYRKLENAWLNAIKNDQNVAVLICAPSDETGRPMYFDVLYQIDGDKAIYKRISNN